MMKGQGKPWLSDFMLKTDIFFGKQAHKKITLEIMQDLRKWPENEVKEVLPELINS